MGNLKKKLEHIYSVRALVMQMEIGEERYFEKKELNAYTAAMVYASKASEQRYELFYKTPFKPAMIKRIEDAELISKYDIYH